MQRFSCAWRFVPRLVAIICLCQGLFGVAQAADATQACDALEVSHAWVRVVPGAPVSAGYFELRNTGATAASLTSASSPQFGRVEMHRSMVGADGMATMKPVAAVTVPPGEMVAFAPGSYHLMLFEPAQTLAPGDAVTLQLQCADSDTPRAVKAEVRSMMPTGQGHTNMDHGDMSMSHGG